MNYFPIGATGPSAQSWLDVGSNPGPLQLHASHSMEHNPYDYSYYHQPPPLLQHGRLRTAASEHPSAAAGHAAGMEAMSQDQQQLTPLPSMGWRHHQQHLAYHHGQGHGQGHGGHSQGLPQLQSHDSGGQQHMGKKQANTSLGILGLRVTNGHC